MNIESYFKSRVEELRAFAERGDPWVFLCASSFIEYLAKVVYDRPTTHKDYKEFLKNYLFTICPEYKTFKYDSGKCDLAEQMYHVLRCGIVHSFSLFPDRVATTNHGGRARSILIAHRKSGRRHLGNYVDKRRNPKLDAAVFIAEDFIDDIAEVTDFIFSQARKRTTSGKQLRSNIRNWVKAYPPIEEIIKRKSKKVEASPQNVCVINRITSG